MVLRQPGEKVQPWIGLVQKVMGRRVKFDWICPKDDESEEWEMFGKYDIWDKKDILATIRN